MLLLAALLVSAGFLFIINLIARSGGPGGAAAVSAFVLVAAFCGVGYIPLSVHAFFACAAGLVLIGMRQRPHTFLKGSLVATLLAYIVVGFIAHSQIEDYDQVRDENPFESLADRLAAEGHSQPSAWGPLGASEPARKRLAEIEKAVDGRARLRAQSLALMHAGYIRQFVESPGFGASRMIFRPGPSHVRLLDEGPLSPDSLGPVSLGSPPRGLEYPPSGTDSVPATPAEEGSEHLWRMHRIGLLEFLYPEGFGYIRDKTQVAGFRAHGFRAHNMQPPPLPQGDGSSLWQVERLELVSLLKQETPVVYVSEYLPRMDRVSEHRTRPLDSFEAAGLAALRKGEDLMKSQISKTLRILGAIRAGKPCLSCHDAERGDLLGAFSYKLRREH